QETNFGIFGESEIKIGEAGSPQDISSLISKEARRWKREGARIEPKVGSTQRCSLGNHDTVRSCATRREAARDASQAAPRNKIWAIEAVPALRNLRIRLVVLKTGGKRAAGLK